MKACPYADLSALVQPHSSASRDDLIRRLSMDNLAHCAQNRPEKELFQRTLAFYVSVRKQGCGAPNDSGPPSSERQFVASSTDVFEDHVDRLVADK